MGDIPMPGDWTLSTMWMPMCGQTWFGAADAFVVMWAGMMLPMMLPSLMPALWSHWKHARRVAGGRPARSTMWVSAGYFLAWTGLGILVFAVGAALAASAIRSNAFAHAIPVCSGVVVLAAGAVQFTAWKARRIACCAHVSLHRPISSADVGTGAAIRHGLELALHSGYCCANLMAVLFAVGVMDPGAMAAVTVAMTIEQWVPSSRRTAKSIGLAVISTGLVLIARTAGLS